MYKSSKADVQRTGRLSGGNDKAMAKDHNICSGESCGLAKDSTQARIRRDVLSQVSVFSASQDGTTATYSVVVHVDTAHP